jgi:hypothetical protein
MNESALALTLGASGDEAFFLFDLTNDMPRLVFGETGAYWWSLGSDGAYADTFYMTNASGAYTYIFGSGGNVVTTGVKIAAATNADYAASAGTAATATGLVDNAVITVAPPTASNSPVDYATFSSALVGNFVSFLTTNRVNASTNAMLPTVPSSSSVTSRQVTAVGQYYITWHATNRTFRQLQGGAAEVELWGCENTPGSLTHKPELYIYVTNTEELIEFGENVASQTVAAGSTLTKQTFSVPYGPFVTNVDCQFVLRLKVTTISGTPTVQIGCGGTTPSHFSIDVPNSSLVPDNAVNAYNLGDLPAASYVTNGQKIAASTNADYATSAGTAGSASNLIQASGSMTNIFVYPFYSVGSAATSLWAWVNEATTITQVWCQADVANSCTATLYSLAVHTNNIAAGTVITNIVVTTTNSQKDCSYTIPANGALLISFGAGYAGATQGNVRCKGIGP